MRGHWVRTSSRRCWCSAPSPHLRRLRRDGDGHRDAVTGRGAAGGGGGTLSRPARRHRRASSTSTRCRASPSRCRRTGSRAWPARAGCCASRRTARSRSLPTRPGERHLGPRPHRPTLCRWTPSTLRRHRAGVTSTSSTPASSWHPRGVHRSVDPWNRASPAFVDPSHDDCQGHGTHVAGTVGGTTWGVAKEVTWSPCGCSTATAAVAGPGSSPASITSAAGRCGGSPT
jgi:subtilisin family serine protease